MHWIALSLLLFAIVLWAGCASHRQRGGRAQQVLYYDRNGDGRVDLERHHFPGLADADWELRNDNYDGRYDKKIVYGYGVVETAIDIEVPADVHLEPDHEELTRPIQPIPNPN